MNWQPIEMADKDEGVRVLLWKEDGPREDEPMRIGSWSEAFNAWTDIDGCDFEPTHFMPLPEPPK